MPSSPPTAQRPEMSSSSYRLCYSPSPRMSPPRRCSGRGDGGVLRLSLKVSQESIFNKMNSSNLACVFGLNLIWPSQGASSLSALVPLNLFTELLIEYYEKIFSAPEASGGHGLAPWGQGDRAAPLQEAGLQTQGTALTKPSPPPRPPTAAGRHL
ncbi:Rho GTPase-activating protein 8 [Plecturocebus cupreus]